MKSLPANRLLMWTSRALPAAAAAAGGALLGALWLRAGVLGRSLVWGANEYPAFGAPSGAWGWLPGAGALAVLAAVVLAALVGELRRPARDPEGHARPQASALWFAAIGALVVLAARALAEMAARARYPLDLLLWSESSFLQDMIKLHLGLPPYLPAGDQNSFVYNPGAPLATWALAGLCGRPRDLTFFRSLQIAFALLAALAAWASARLLAGGPARDDRRAPAVSWALGLFVLAAALNPVTSPFVDLLHTDALALLTSALGLLALSARPKVSPARWLLFAAPIPAAAFLVKQTGSVVWLGMTLGVWLQDRRLRPTALFGLLSGALIAGVVWGLSAWSHGWWSYWTVDVLKYQQIILLKGLQFNALVILPLALPALAALGWLARGVRRPEDGPGRAFFSAALYTVLLAGSATVTTFKCGTYGANHWGSAALGVFTLGAAAADRFLREAQGGPSARRIGRVAAALVILAAALPHRTSRPVPGPEEYRYAERCNQLFATLDLGRTLLDHGSLPYLQRGLLPYDRANSVLETASGGVCEIDDAVDRIMSQAYDRILIHRHFGESWYTGEFSRALSIAYEVKDRVPGLFHQTFNGFLMTDILVYERKPAAGIERLPTIVLSTEPPVCSENGRVPREVRVRFNHPMKPETINPNTTYLTTRDKSGVVSRMNVPPSCVRYEPESSTAVITPPAPLKRGRYWIIVTDGARDLHGRTVWPGGYSGKFRIKRVYHDYETK